MSMTNEGLDKIIKNLPKEDKLRIIRSLQEYKEKLSSMGKEIIEERIEWIKKTIKIKQKKK